MVDLKGIEPSNLTDANRALSQLSYRPIYLPPEPQRLLYYIRFFQNVKGKFYKFFSPGFFSNFKNYD